MGAIFKMGIVPNLMDFSNPVSGISLSYIFLTGISIDFLFFNFVLIYKSRMMEIRINAQQIEKQKELFDQRVEIGQDLHDHVGASLSGLNVFSDIAKKAINTDIQLAGYYLDKVSNGIKQLMSNMNDVVWALNEDPSQEKLLTSRIKDFYVEIFEAKEIICTYDVDPEVEKKITKIKARKNILLIAKESINNAIKHSNSNKILISLTESEGFLILLIRDYGVGFFDDSPKTGKGLSGLQLRTQQLGGSLEVGNVKNDAGAYVTCSIPLANISDFII
jgi:signal transduction histidine kinase